VLVSSGNSSAGLKAMIQRAQNKGMVLPVLYLSHAECDG
jgi:hypothetical protein